MSKQGPKHIAVHINELVLPPGSRMPDQATLRRMVEAAVLHHATGTDPHGNDARTVGQQRTGSIADAVTRQVKLELIGGSPC